MRRSTKSSADAGANAQRALGRARHSEPELLCRLAVSLKQQWKRYHQELGRCQERLSPGAVHQARVASRRLLAMADLIEHFVDARRIGKVGRALKRLLDTLDELRDTQVQLQTLRKLRHRAQAARALLEHLRKHERRQARDARHALRDLKTKRLARAITACRHDLDAWGRNHRAQTADTWVLRTVRAAFARTRRLRAGIKPDDPHTIHRTRVAFKRFRYMLEILAEHWPADARLLTAMHAYQTRMGRIQDAQVLLRTFAKFARKHDCPPESAGGFQRELLRRRQELIQAYLKTADRLSEFGPATGWLGRAPTTNRARYSRKPGREQPSSNGAPDAGPPQPVPIVETNEML